MVFSKIIVDLIEYYKGFEVFNIAEKIKIKNINIIKDNINIFTKLDLDLDFKYFKSKNIDDIYIRIIKEMILKKKFKDYEYVLNIPYFSLWLDAKDNLSLKEYIIFQSRCHFDRGCYF